MPAIASDPTGMVVQIRLLGPVEVRGPAGPAEFSGSRQPTLLGLLALAVPEPVPRSRLIDGLWGDDPPRTALRTLHSHVARVRQALDRCGLPDLIRTREPGYRLAVDPMAVDVHRFEREVAAARGDLAGGPDAGAVARLRDALALWRGDAFADAEPFGWGAAEVARLHEARLGALGDLWDGELRLGRHAAAVGELERLLIRHPFQERLVWLAMLALYRCGRPSDALTLYQRLRVHLSDELGTQPGPELARLHVRILRADPALDHDGRYPRQDQHRDRPNPYPRRGEPGPSAPRSRPRPAELPGQVGHFTGRTAELAELDRLAGGPRTHDAAPDRDAPGPADRDAPNPGAGRGSNGGPGGGGATRVVVISGAAGMGKTTLAVRWGRVAAAGFPDGQIFLDLNGHDPAATTAADALAHVLASLDQPDTAVPADLSARVGLYRSLTRDRRLLVVADNAGGVDQILPLVPASPSTLLVVTSRRRLAALATHHPVHFIELDVLPPDEALQLLDSVLGADRLAREPDGARRLVELCDRMPLALRIAAAKLVSRPRKGIGELADELAGGQRLDELSVAGDSYGVRHVFATAYQMLAPPTARQFRLLGLHPGGTFDTHLAAAATALPLPAARRALDELAAAHLIVEVANGRYRFHDLIRLYARECACLAEPAAERDAAVDRILDWYLAVTDAANRIVDPGRDRVRPTLRHRVERLPFPADPHEALAFLDGERDNLLPVLRYAAQHGRPDLAWQLTYLVTGFFDSRGHWARRVQICRCGLDAARATGDPVAVGLMASGLGVAYLMTRQFDEALTELHHALSLMRDQGDRRGEAHVYNNIAVAYARSRRFASAIEAYGRSLALHSAEGSSLGVALSLSNLGDAYVRLGRADLALEHLGRALAVSREIGNVRLEAAALSGLGQAYRHQRQWDAAVAHFEQALELRRAAGDLRYEADTLNNLGLTELDRGRLRLATAHFDRALTVSREIADPHQEAVALAELGRIEVRRGNLDEAHGHLSAALAVRALAPDPYETAGIHRDLAELARRTGRPHQAREHHRLATELYRQVDAGAHATRPSAVAAPA